MTRNSKPHNGRRWRRPTPGAVTVARFRDIDVELIRTLKGPRPYADYICDGCSGAPDMVGPVNVTPACIYHDYAYHRGGDEKARAAADGNFFRNIRTCGGNWWLAMLYWLEVRRFGFSHFRYHGLSKPGWLQRKWIIWVTRWLVFFAA